METIDKLLDKEKDIAVTFLKKVFDHENNLQLSEIKKGLELDFILRHIDNIKLNDVLKDNKNIKKTRKRKEREKYNKEEMKMFNNIILEFIQTEEEGLETKRIVEHVNSKMEKNLSQKIIYNRLLCLKNKNILNSYKIRKKCYWTKNIIFNTKFNSNIQRN